MANGLKQGAQTLGAHMDNVYGKDSMAMIVDEGSTCTASVLRPITLKYAGIDGFSDVFGGIIAAPAVGEKGRVDVRVEVNAPGGHSSVPPAHTVST